MPFQKIKIICLVTFVSISSGCTKHHLQAQEPYTGKKKHAPVLETSLSFSTSDYNLSEHLSGPLKDSLDQAVTRLLPLPGVPGISTAMLVPGKGLWQTTAGFISKPNHKLSDSTTVFYWASVGKLLTATIIDQLVQEKKLSYQDKLAKWFPKFDHARNITIEQLLNHTSGLASFNTDPALFSRNKYYSTSELIKIALRQKNLFPPGSYWSYSNTGYLLLALIIQQTENRSFAESVKHRLSVPLNLPSLRVLAPDGLPGNLALGHNANNELIAEDFSVPVGAGNIAGNAKDMVLLLHALMSGKIVPTSVVYDRLQDLFPMFDQGMYYGKGIMLTDFAEINGGTDWWIGHSGGTESYRALLIYDVGTKAFLSVSVNAHFSVEAIARKLLSLVE